MIDPSVLPARTESVETVLQSELARGDAVAEAVPAVLRHLVTSEDTSLYSDEILARVRGMLADIAGVLLDALAGVDREQRGGDDPARAALTESLVQNPGLLGHLHGNALEWQLTERLQARIALDPVVSPLLRALVASADPATQGLAMTFLAAQARWCQGQRRMNLSVFELPGELFHAVLLSMRQIADTFGASPRALDAAEASLRGRYDEAANRVGLAGRMVLDPGGGARAALSVGHAGVPLFLTALATSCGQSRELAVLSTHEGQVTRLALGLRAAGLTPCEIEEQVLTIHPDVLLPPGFDRLGPDRAAAILASGCHTG